MDLSSIEPLVGIQNWQHAAQIIASMTPTESHITLAGMASYLVERERHGGIRENDDLYAIRAAVRATDATMHAVYGTVRQGERNPDPWSRDQREDEPPF